MNPLDRALIDAADAAFETGDEGRSLGPYLERPVRALALVIRAGDTRLPPPAERDHPLRQTVELDGVTVRDLCRPIRIDPPGIAISRAAERFGVGVNTIRRWEKRGLVRIDRFHGVDSDPELNANGSHAIVRRGDLKLPTPGLVDEAKRSARYFPGPSRRRLTAGNRVVPTTNMAFVTTPRALSPGGQVMTMPWGRLLRELHLRAGDEFSQRMVRERRAIGGRRQGGQWQWVCPRCGARVFKLYMPTWPWTLRDRYADRRGDLEVPAPRRARGFVCRRCARVVYESSERTSRAGDDAGAAPVDPWDRFVRRISAGWVGAGAVAPPAGPDC